MDTIAQHLNRTIKALESLSEKLPNQSDEIYELLDQLYQQKMDLNLSAMPHSAGPYQVAMQAIKAAASAAEGALKDTGRTADALAKSADATRKLARLFEKAN